MNDWMKLYKRGGHSGHGSGPGSIYKNNLLLIEWLNRFIKDNKIKSILDMGCGDMQWMPYVNLEGVDYTGVDYVDYLIEESRKKLPHLTFLCKDILSPKFSVERPFDLVFCKDVWHHCEGTERTCLMANIQKVEARFRMLVGPSSNHKLENWIFEYICDPPNSAKRVFLI